MLFKQFRLFRNGNIDYNKYDTYAKWKNTPNYHSKLLSGYNKAPSSTAKREFGLNDVDSRIEGIISSLNQHIKYTEVKDSLLFVNTCILALFNDEFRQKIIDGFYDSDPISLTIDEMQTIIVRTGGEIDNYSFTNLDNKKSITSLIKSTCTAMHSKKELESSIYSLVNFLKDLAKLIKMEASRSFSITERKSNFKLRSFWKIVKVYSRDTSASSLLWCFILIFHVLSFYKSIQ